MPFKSKKPAVLEHEGFRVGEKVCLAGVAMPREVGKITRISSVKFYKKSDEYFETVFEVNVEGQAWFPIEFGELKKVI